MCLLLLPNPSPQTTYPSSPRVYLFYPIWSTPLVVPHPPAAPGFLPERRVKLAIDEREIKPPGPVCVFACELIEDSVNYRRVFFFFIIPRALPRVLRCKRARPGGVLRRGRPPGARRNEFIRSRGHRAVLRSLLSPASPSTGSLVSRPKQSSAKIDVLIINPRFPPPNFRRFFAFHNSRHAKRVRSAERSTAERRPKEMAVS